MGVGAVDEGPAEDALDAGAGEHLLDLHRAAAVVFGQHHLGGFLGHFSTAFLFLFVFVLIFF